MREIKFRAFDKNQEKVLPVNSLKSICIHSERLTEDEFDNLIIMQFTGMHDKNGVEIYDGDILHYRLIDLCDENGFYDIYVKCVFQDCAFGWIGETTGRFISFCEQSLSDHEIVGNIYQNPELLK